MKINCDFAVVGGGAAGFFAALAAAEARPDFRIVILEKGNHPLAKLRVSGGGRCNVTHACFDPAELVEYYPRGGRELHGPFSRFQPRDTVAWFEKHNVNLKTEPDGRIFPVSNRSETVIDCFMGEAQRLGIELQTHQVVETIQPSGQYFELSLGNGERMRTRKILLAPGGGSKTAYALAKSLGHTIVPPLPSLFSFKIVDPRLDGLAGVSVPMAEIMLDFNTPNVLKAKRGLVASGPLLITHWGLSGPAVLSLSAWGARFLGQAGYRAGLQVNWVASHNSDRILIEFSEIKYENAHKLVVAHSPFRHLPDRLWNRLVGAAGIDSAMTWTELSKSHLLSLAKELCAGRFQIIGKGIFKDEFVTCGGVSLKEVNFRSLESRLQPGVYFAGEYLDIDGLTGGFNFQAAWTTAWIAGKSAVQPV